MTLPSTATMAAIAVTRFGLGAKPGELAVALVDPQAYLVGQIRTDGADQPQDNAQTTLERGRLYLDYQRVRQMEAQAQTGAATPAAPPSPALKALGQNLRDAVALDFFARFRLGTSTEAGFRERWTLFWCNHFTVSAVKQTTAPLIGPFEQEVVRPRVFGSFSDLLIACSTHPAMLFYLDQFQSIGPNSIIAQRQRQRANPRTQAAGLNENLAREILELHTVGLNAKYQQADVTEFARALTGWSIGGQRDPEPTRGLATFRDIAHEPGTRTVLGRHYPDTGQDQAFQILRDLARHPATARHIAEKIAVHFVADAPPKALVRQLERAFIESDGQLDVVARALITAPEAWTAEAAKIKTPYDYLLSSWRLIGQSPEMTGNLNGTLAGLGQTPFSPPSPKGWPEESTTWAAPDALVKRLTWAEDFAARSGFSGDPGTLARDGLGNRLTPMVAMAVARAESRQEALTLLLMSPEFQRR